MSAACPGRQVWTDTDGSTICGPPIPTPLPVPTWDLDLPPWPTAATPEATPTPTPAAVAPAATTATTTPAPVPAVVTDRPDVVGAVGVVGLALAVAVALAAVVVNVRRHDRAGELVAVARLGARRLAWPLRRAWRVRHLGARLVCMVVVVVGGGLAVATWVPVLLLLPALAVAVLALGGVHRLVLPAREPEAESWWSERVLVGILTRAGVLARTKADAPPVTLRRFGAPQHEDGGTSVKVGLPSGVTASSVAARREAIAAELGVPVTRLDVRHDPADPPNRVTLAVLPSRSPGSAASPLATVTSTRWAAPVRIGADSRGRAVTLATTEENVLIAGRPGAGKTTTARVVLAHYLLDPTAEVFLLDGKGSVKDYGAARPLCSRFVSGADEDAVAQTEVLLDEVLTIVRARNAASDGTAPGGLLVLLEELQDVRAAADKGTRECIDAVLGRIVRMGRAVGVTVLVSTQRPSVDDLPSGVRNLISQRLALMLRNGSDAALVLGQTPDLPLPTKRGEALLTTATGTTAVQLDHLTDDAWRAVCARATTLRPAVPVVPPEPVVADLPEPVVAAAQVPPEPAADVQPEPPAPVRDPLVHAVVEVLKDSDPRGLPATALLALIPGWLAPASPALLGRALGRAAEVERGHVGKAPVWRLADPSVTPRSTPRSGGTEGSAGGETAGQPDAVPSPSVPPVGGGAA